MRKPNWFAIFFREAFLGAAVVVISLPLLLGLHRAVGISNPPLSAFVMLGGGVAVAFAGAGIIGALIGQTRSRGSIIASGVGALIWAVLLVAWLVPAYTGSILDSMGQDAALMAWEKREALAQGAKETLDQARNGHATKAATDAAMVGAEKAKIVALGGVARLPALILLLWALMGAPIVAMLECRSASR